MMLYFVLSSVCHTNMCLTLNKATEKIFFESMSLVPLYYLGNKEIRYITVLYTREVKNMPKRTNTQRHWKLL